MTAITKSDGFFFGNTFLRSDFFKELFPAFCDKSSQKKPFFKVIIRASVGRFILPKKCAFFCSGLSAAIWARDLGCFSEFKFEDVTDTF